MGLLDSVKVVSLEQAVAAPLCTRRLVQAGAEVFKIERPEGDFARDYDSAVAGQSAYFVWLNAGKKSVVLDLRRAADVATLIKLIGRSDILVQNLKPGALAKLGVDLDVLHRERPDLISISIAGFHPDGPGRDRKAYDLLMQAESGLADITGTPDAPGRVGVSLVDLATGMFAYEAALQALLERVDSGIGRRINIALFDAVAEWLAVPYLLDRYGGAAPKRVGLAHPGICPYGVFTSRDGQPFVLSIQNEREWQRLCEAGLEDLDLLEDERCVSNEVRVAHRTFVDGRVQAIFAALDYDVIRARLDTADVAFAPVNAIEALKHHPDFRTSSVDVGGATVELPALPGITRDDVDARVPPLGEHTEEVLRWLDRG